MIAPPRSAPLWLAWEDDSSIRSRVLADEMGAAYRAMTLFDRSRFFGWLRYPTAIAQTFWTLIRHRPDLVVVQNPSILLAFQAAILKSLLGYRLAIDLHTPFARSPGILTRILTLVHEYGLRHCDVVIVSNAAYQRRVATTTRAAVVVLPDRVPRLAAAPKPVRAEPAHSVLYICTFSVDEPWQEVLAAARLLPPNIRLYISGRARITQESVPQNVVLTGFLPMDEYHGLLQGVDAVMVLTTAEENLVCGGYEAVAAGKPLILSDTVALRTYFHRGTVFTANTAPSIAKAITSALERGPSLATETAQLRQELVLAWNAQWNELLAILAAPSRSHRGAETAGAI